jgi:hypothetical protein
MANLWERMSHLYGHKFTSAFGETAIANGDLTEVAKTWASGLRGVTGEQIAKGLHAICARSDAWPPTLPEFRAACIGKAVNEFGLDYVPEYYRTEPVREQSRLLSSDERDARRSKASERINEMRAALGKRSVEKPLTTDAPDTTINPDMDAAT